MAPLIIYCLILSIAFCVVVLFSFSLIDQNLLLKQISEMDKMTHLPNAHGFVHEINLKIPRTIWNKYDAIHFDIVRMSNYNRKYGNLGGNEIIEEYARVLRKSLDEDEILGRLGGNYFIAFIKRIHTKDFLDKLAGLDINVFLPNQNEMIQEKIQAVAGIYEIQNGKIEPNQILNLVTTTGSIAKNVKHNHTFILQQSCKRKSIS